MSDKVAVVTGANKGIGLAIVRELLKRNVSVVYLTSRNLSRGKKAVEELNKEGLNPEYYQLDVTDRESVEALASHINEKHGGIDILINNAAVLVNDYYKTTYDDAKYVINVNYRSLLIIQEFIFPILRDNARVINMSSDCGHISNLKNKYWIERLSRKDIKVEDVNAFVDWFLDSVKYGTMKEEDFAEKPVLAYRISKIALSALTIIQQREVDRNISVNSLHPGFVQTSMTKNLGFMRVEDSGKAPAYLALDAPQTLKGSFVCFDKRVVDWSDYKADYRCHFEMFGNLLKEAGYV